MITTAKLERVFQFKNNGQELLLADPSPDLSAQQVLDFYAGTYPILTTARIEGPEIIQDQIRFRFTSSLGTKG